MSTLQGPVLGAREARGSWVTARGLVLHEKEDHPCAHRQYEAGREGRRKLRTTWASATVQRVAEKLALGRGSKEALTDTVGTGRGQPGGGIQWGQVGDSLGGTQWGQVGDSLGGDTVGTGRRLGGDTVGTGRGQSGGRGGTSSGLLHEVQAGTSGFRPGNGRLPRDFQFASRKCK